MKKILVMVAALAMMLVASSAQAAVKVHGNFDSAAGGDSSGCAACHITHAANAAKLLLTGNNQTEFCYDCHGTMKPKSPYDVENGVTLNGTDGFDYTVTPLADWGIVANYINPSYSGGFAKTYDFKGNADTAMAPADIGGAMFKGSTSAHNVQAISLNGTSPWNSGSNIPGGTHAVSGSVFTCSSCHDPHGYDSTAAGSGGTLDNPRLLRHNLPARNTGDGGPVDVSITIDVTNDVYGNATEGTLRTTGYPDATINKWCGGCHDALDVGKNAGSNKGADTRFRHAMGIALTTTAGVDVTLAKGTPLATGNKLICLSCHRAHGTAASMSAVANSWTGQNYDDQSLANVAKSGAALLRLDNRDVCYNCHGAAQRNINATAGAARLAPTY